MYSALPLSAYTSLLWFNAQPPGTTLPVITSSADFATGPFAVRDANLAYRDLILAVTIAQVATSIGDVWGVSVPYPTVSGDPVGTMEDMSVDLIGTNYGSPGAVIHVDNQSVPINAVTADEGLYARDLIIYAWLYNVASQLSPDLLAPLPLPPTTLNEIWSVAAGAFGTGTVSQGYPLNVALFKTPDQALADRDNTLAHYVANIRYNLDRIWTVANRLLVQTVSPDANVAEPEVYQLVSVTPTQRVWSLWPRLQGTAGQIVYNTALDTVTWQDEVVGPSTSGVPAAPAFTTPDGGIVQLQYQVPDAPDAEFFRQKSARLVVRSWRDNLVFSTTTPENYITSGGLWQPTSVLITTPGIIQFYVPSVVPAGPIRVGLLVKPSRILNIFGYQNTTGSANGTAVTLQAAGSVSWSFAAPAGGILVAFSITDLVNPTSSFQISVSYNATLIYSGAWSFGQVPGTAVLTPPVQLTATGAPSTLTVTWLGNPGGQLTINEVQVTTVLPVNTPVDYDIGATIGTVGSPITQFSGIPERLDCVWLDVFNPGQQIVPTLAVNWFGSAGIALYVYAFDIRWYQGTTKIQDAPLYEFHKRSLLEQAGDTVVQSWGQVVPLLGEIRTTSSTYGFIWDNNANQRWLNAISIAQPRLFQAFQVAGPGDLGRPALVPDGLIPASDGTGTILANYATPLLTPCLRVCQPWMIDFGCLVAGPDFWPTITRAASQQTGANLVAPNFSYTIINPLTGGPSISNLTSVSSVVGLPTGDSFMAYNLLNQGPGGGYTSQAITLTVWMINLQVGSTYTITVTYQVTTVPGGVVTSATQTSTVIAASTIMSQALPTFTASLGTTAQVLSVTLV